MHTVLTAPTSRGQFVKTLTAVAAVSHVRHPAGTNSPVAKRDRHQQPDQRRLRLAFRRLHRQCKEWKIWAKNLVDGGKAVALLNLSDKDQVSGVSKSEIGLSGTVRDLWRQKDVGPMGDKFSAMVSPHGVAFVKIVP